MNRNILYVVIALLVVVVAGLGYFYYRDHKTTTGVDINVGEQGISIQKK